MTTRQINLIPDDASPRYREALGYPWQDRRRGIPGDDRPFGGRTAVETREAVLAEVAKEYPTIQYIDERDGALLPDGTTVAVRITGLWCGGGTLLGYIPTGQSPSPRPMTAGGTLAETAAQVDTADRMALAEQDDQWASTRGYCRKCHTVCYGDCDAND